MGSRISFHGMSKFGPDNDPKSKTLVCRTCGRNFRPGTKFCGFDGTPLSASIITTNPAERTQTGGTTSILDEIKVKICPTCGRTYPENMQFCRTDGRSLIFYDQPKQSGQVQSASNPEVSGLKSGNGGAVQSTIDSSSTEKMKANLVGQTLLGKYCVEAVLGEGGMAHVYRAKHLQLEKPVVIKVMRGNLPQEMRAKERFERESKLTAKLQHPNVVTVIDTGVLDQGQPYLVMEYIEGESLRSKLSREGCLSPYMTARILMQVCGALQAAHREGIVHRDLKPENIMLRHESDRPDWVKVVDFGIARLQEQTGPKLTAYGKTMGSVDYMAPEYLKDKELDSRADLYALGVILFEMLTGRRPFLGDTPRDILLSQLQETPPPPSSACKDLEAGGIFDHIVARALEKDPNNRYQSTAELNKHLQQALQMLKIRKDV